MGPMAKWKLFDNLRRSLVAGVHPAGPGAGHVPVRAGVRGGGGGGGPGRRLPSASFRGRSGLPAGKRPYGSATTPLLLRGLEGFSSRRWCSFCSLPYQAWICASAALTALWRMGVSHKKLLAWTTAAEAERRAGDGLWANYQKMWPSVAAGLLCVVCSRFPAGAAVGLVWMASPVFSWAMSRPVARAQRLEKEDRPFLLHQAALIWQYFAEFLRPQDHWLPPDNWQEQPAVGLARRTSPTNIGMALLCCLAAADPGAGAPKPGALPHRAHSGHGGEAAQVAWTSV